MYEAPTNSVKWGTSFTFAVFVKISERGDNNQNGQEKEAKNEQNGNRQGTHRTRPTTACTRTSLHDVR
jgi:hypothetical protein